MFVGMNCLVAAMTLGHAVALLDLAGELVAAAGDDVEVVIGQLAPLLRAIQIPCPRLPTRMPRVCERRCLENSPEWLCQTIRRGPQWRRSGAQRALPSSPSGF